MAFLSRLAKFWGVLLLAGLGGYIALYNQDRVVVVLPPWIQQVTVPAYVAFIGAFLLGAGVASVYFGVEHFRKSLAIRALNRRLTVAKRAPDSSAKRAPAEPTLGPSVGPET